MKLDIESIMEAAGIEPTVRHVAGVRSILATVDQVRASDRKDVIVFAAYDAEGKVVTRGETTSTDPLLEINVMTTALELTRAIDRGIDITAADMWTHITKSLPPDAPSANSAMVRSALKQRDAANKRCDTLSDRNEFLERNCDALAKLVEDHKKTILTMSELVKEDSAELTKCKEKVAMFDWLIEQCGSTRDGTYKTVSLSQDDATHECFVSVGGGWYRGSSIEEAIKSGMKGG
jgi:hypothetical protein